MESPPLVENPTAWVFKICDNLVLDEMRKNQPTLPIEEQVVSASTTGSLTVAETESNTDFFSLLSRLDEESATIVKLSVWDGYNLKEIAKILNLSHGTARQKYSRALKKLKNYL